MNNDRKDQVPQWLQDLQQKSWEPEILLSGIVLYGMFKVPALLDEFLVFFKANIFGNGNNIDNLIGFSKMGIYWLITGLILHLICRGIWIGMVGLSYTFPQGIQIDKLSYKAKFHEKLKKIPAFEASVIRLEKISSSLFSVSFMLFMSLMGGYVYFLVFLIIPVTFIVINYEAFFEGTSLVIFQTYAYFILIVGFLGLIDFVSLGYFRRFKWLAKIYWPLHALISTLTLSRFYRSIYYGMVSNNNKWVCFFFLLIFSFISIAGASIISNSQYPGQSYSRLDLWSDQVGYTAFAGYYDDQFSKKIHIPSDIISENVLKVFIPARIAIEDEMLKLMSLDSLKEVHPDTAEVALELMVIEAFYLLKIDEEPVDIERWYTHYKKRTGQFGYLAYVDISSLPQGLHTISLSSNSATFKSNFVEIPFYRDVSFRPSSPKGLRKEGIEQEQTLQPKPFGVLE